MNSRPLRLLALLTVLMSAFVLAACGEEESSGGNAGADPATLAPAGSPLYFEAAVKPGENQSDALDSLVSKVGGDRDLGEDIKRLINKEIQEDESGKDNSYEEDIEPWLGDRIGVFISSLGGTLSSARGSGAKPDVPYGLVVATKDAGKAKDKINELADETNDAKGEYKGVEFRKDDDTLAGVVGDFLILAEEASFKQMVDVEQGAGSLAASAKFKSATDTLPADRLGYGYVDAKAILDQVAQAGLLPANLRGIVEKFYGSAVKGTLTFSAVARDDGILVETATPAVPGGKTTDLLGELPGDSWFAIATADVGTSLESSLAALAGIGSVPSATGQQVDPSAVLRQFERQLGIDVERDITSWVGDTAFFASGSSLLNIVAGAVIRTKNPAVSRRALDRLQVAVARLGADEGVSVTGTASGFRVEARGVPAGIEVAQRGDEVVIAYGNGAVAKATAPPEKLADAAGYKAARQSIGSDIQPSGFIAFAPILALAEGLGAGSSTDYKAAKPYLDALDSIIFGSKAQGDKTVGRFLVKVK